MMTFEEQYNKYISLIDENLEYYFPSVPIAQARVIDAAQYSLFGGGKRVRPILLLEFCRLFGGDIEKALPFACAIEMIHTYSLIHDDLPSMDDDDLRRGRPTNHKIFGEATAVLAGDTLLTAAFETMLDPDNIEGIDPMKVIKAAHCIAWAAGAFGMVGGQMLDIDSECDALPLDAVTEIHNLKTGSLICAASQAGCILAGADVDQLSVAHSYSQKLGLAFQIRDDIMDADSDNPDSADPADDAEVCDKLTFVKIMGIEKCSSYIASLTEDAKNSLSGIEGSGFLTWFADKLAHRER